MSRLAARVGAHSLVYVLAAVTSVVAGLLSLVVFTRYLRPAQYGELALLLALSSFATIFFNAGSLQGTNSWVYAAGGDDDAIDDDSVRAAAPDRRRALATGLALTLGIGAIGTLLAFALSGPIATYILDARASRALVTWGVGAGSLAAVWRLAANAIRLEQRPWSYLFVTAAQHLLGIAFAIPLLEEGRGVEGVVIGLALGNLLAAIAAVALIRRNLRLAVSWFDVVNIMRRGRALLPVVAAVHFVQLADVLLMSRFLPESTIGVYRVASRIGSFISYWTSSFHMAWGSLRRGALHSAADAERGAEVVASRMATYFSLITFGGLLGLSLYAEELVRLASPGYEKAADLVPIASFGWASYGFFILAYRASNFPSRRRWWVALTLLSAVVFAGLAQASIPLWGAYGASAAVIAGWWAGIVIMVVRGQRGAHPTPYQYGRILAGLLLALTCLAAAKLVAPGGNGGQLVVDTLAFLLYPVLLCVTGVIPRHHVAGALSMVRVGLGPRWSTRIQDRLTPEDQAIIHALVREQRTLSDVATAAQVDEEEVGRRLVEALRRCSDLGGPRDGDERLGAYLLMRAAYAEREAAAREMFAEGVDPLEADVLTRTMTALRRLSARRWRAVAPLAASGWAELSRDASTGAAGERAPQTR